MAAGKGIGIDELVTLIEDNLFGNRKEFELLIPYDAGGIFSRMQGETEILLYEYREDGIYVKAALDETAEGRYRKYII